MSIERTTETSTGSAPKLVLPGCEGSARVALEDARAAFSEGLCEACGNPQGTRTAHLLEVHSVTRSMHGLSARVHSAGHRFRRRLYSDAFLSRLTAAERTSLELRPVKMAEPGRRLAFFELVGATHVLPSVAVRGRSEPGHLCRRCGVGSVPMYPWGYPIPRPRPPMDFVARSALPQPVPAVIAVRSLQTLDLAFTASRWDELCKPKPLPGFRTHELGVLDDADIEPNPPQKVIWE